MDLKGGLLHHMHIYNNNIGGTIGENKSIITDNGQFVVEDSVQTAGNCYQLCS